MGRVLREVGIRMFNMQDADEATFRIGSYTLGGNTSLRFPWQQYIITEMKGWTLPGLPDIWEDFAGGDEGIILTIWNISWLHWLTRPTILPEGPLRSFLQTGRVKVWSYIPIDSVGPGGRVSREEGRTIQMCDRYVAYTGWGAKIIEATIESVQPKFREVKAPPVPKCYALPHGTDGSIFFKRDRQESRNTFTARLVREEKPYRLDPEAFLIGVNATNTPRKDWGLAFQTVSILERVGMKVGLLAHTNKLQDGAWDLIELHKAMGLYGRVIFTDRDFTDEEMSWWYAACDCTLGIGAGEGWGLPMSESLACGVPVLTVDYAGALEFVAKSNRIVADAWRYENMNLRPVSDPNKWAGRIIDLKDCPDKFQRNLDERLFWETGAWETWEKWLREGLK